MTRASLTISSRNYSSWSLRGWLLCRMAGIDFEEVVLPSDDPDARAELLHLAPSFLVPRLTHAGATVWSTLAIAEYLNEVAPEAGLYPKDPVARAHCRSVAGEMHSGFANLRAALPMNLKSRHPGFKVWAGAKADVDRVSALWRECLARHGGPFLFGTTPTVADALYAPVAARFVTYEVVLEPVAAAYRDHIMAWPLLSDWIAAAEAEPDDIDELDVEF